MSLKVGEAVPDFSLVAENGKPYKLSNKIKKNLLIVFYPGDGLPVCTNQFTDYRDNVDEFSKLGVEIVGISPNDRDSHTSFKNDNKLPFVLLSDINSSVAKEYNCYDWFGTKRAVFLVDKDLELKYKCIESVSIFKKTSQELLASIKKNQ